MVTFWPISTSVPQPFNESPKPNSAILRWHLHGIVLKEKTISPKKRRRGLVIMYQNFPLYPIVGTCDLLPRQAVVPIFLSLCNRRFARHSILRMNSYQNKRRKFGKTNGLLSEFFLFRCQIVASLIGSLSLSQACQSWFLRFAMCILQFLFCFLLLLYSPPFLYL